MKIITLFTAISPFLSCAFWVFADATPITSARTAQHAMIDAKDQPHIIMLYGGYGAYARKENGQMKGITPPYVEKMALGGGFKVTWLHNLNWASTLKQNRPNFCYSTLLKSKGREKFATFTLPIGLISRYVVVTHQDNKSLQKHTSLAQAINTSPLKLSMIKKVSYGLKINALKASPKVKKIEVTTPRMLVFLKNKAVDYALVPEKSALRYIEEQNHNNLILIDHYKELENYRPAYHIACSKSTSRDVIDAMNEQIKKLGWAE